MITGPSFKYLRKLVFQVLYIFEAKYIFHVYLGMRKVIQSDTKLHHESALPPQKNVVPNIDMGEKYCY